VMDLEAIGYEGVDLISMTTGMVQCRAFLNDW
jgi:hypothetical protein